MVIDCCTYYNTRKPFHPTTIETGINQKTQAFHSITRSSAIIDITPPPSFRPTQQARKEERKTKRSHIPSSCDSIAKKPTKEASHSIHQQNRTFIDNNKSKTLKVSSRSPSTFLQQQQQHQQQQQLQLQQTTCHRRSVPNTLVERRLKW